MAGWSDLVGKGGIVETILVWGVLNQQLQALLGPEVDLVGQDVNAAHPIAVLSPALLADMAVRGIRPEGQGAEEAAKSGIDSARFHDLVLGAGEPPGLEFMLEALRRGFIPVGQVTDDGPSLAGGVAKSRLYTQWLDTILAMREVPIPPAAAVDAALRGQRPRPEMEKEAWASGVTAERFSVLFDSAGRPPSPGELIELVRRGFIPMRGVGPAALSLQQGIFEGDSKDKWEPAYEELVHYKPPPRTVTTLLAHGAISEATALALFVDAGLDPDLAAAYVASAKTTRTAGHRQITEGQITRLYSDRIMTAAQATAALAALGYSPADVTLILELADTEAAHAAYRAAEGRIGRAFVAGAIDTATARHELGVLDVPAPAQDHLLVAWAAEKAATPKVLSDAQLCELARYGIDTPASVLARLEARGWSAGGAWDLLAVHLHAPVPHIPRPA